MNEAAERLRHLIERWSSPATAKSLEASLDEALADERKPLVEAIRHTLEAVNAALDKSSYGDSVESDLLEAHATLDTAIRDAEMNR